VDYSKDTLYKKPNEIPAKVIAQRTTGWDQETVMFGENIQLEKNMPWPIFKYYIPHSKYRLVRPVTSPAVSSKRLAIESILWSRLSHVIFTWFYSVRPDKWRVSVLNLGFGNTLFLSHNLFHQSLVTPSLYVRFRDPISWLRISIAFHIPSRKITIHKFHLCHGSIFFYIRA